MTGRGSRHFPPCASAGKKPLKRSRGRVVNGYVTDLLGAPMSDSFENEFLNRLFTALRKDELVLPTLPEMALKIRDIVSDPERSLGDVARAVVKDPALSARVIQIANSPVLG